MLSLVGAIEQCLNRKEKMRKEQMRKEQMSKARKVGARMGKVQIRKVQTREERWFVDTEKERAMNGPKR